MKLPRDLSGSEPAKVLGRVGYGLVRQTESHMRLTRDGPEQHHMTTPAHDPSKLGTLAAILGEASSHLKMDCND
jgi:predicted RNA binding protein YcfA (HicA-like mRNA interferase family)